MIFYQLQSKGGIASNTHQIFNQIIFIIPKIQDTIKRNFRN